MSASSPPGNAPDPQKMMSAMFVGLVMQYTNMAMVFLGQSPNPQTGQIKQELEHAQYFIDQLEMLAVKTKGNLDRNEEMMLKQSLTAMRLAFVEAVSKPAPSARAAEIPPTDEQETASAELPPEGEPAGAAAPIATPEEAAAQAEAESKKKFTKKY